MRGISASAADWKIASRTVPTGSLTDAQDVRFGQLEALQDRLGVLDQDLGVRGQLHSPARLDQQRQADLALELGELLRHRRRALVQRVRDRRQAARTDSSRSSRSLLTSHMAPSRLASSTHRKNR